jgi:H+/Cl- antiporter ClcA
MLRARPLAPLAAGFVAGIALALLQGAWIPLAALGALSAILSIRWRHPLLLAVLGLGLGALRQRASETQLRGIPRAIPLEGRVEGCQQLKDSWICDPN